MLDKWKKAVVHLECATDSEHVYDYIKRIESLREQLKSGKITWEQYSQLSLPHSKDIRYHGTALFVKHKGKRYLLTARHVVFDESSAKREIQEVEKRELSFNRQPSKYSYEMALERIFNIIFRVPSLDAIINSDVKSHQEFLMNLGAGGNMAYTFSPPELDLAVISLDQRNANFADQLVKIGYEPIESKFIGEQPSCEGSEVFTVGYPSSTALLGQVSQYPALANWSSSYFSLPVFAFGRVAMMHDKLPFFWIDMSIYPGNSGGPIIQDGMLVGIVSAQATLPIDDVPTVRTRIPFGKIIKSSNILGLLEIQSEKDLRYSR